RVILVGVDPLAIFGSLRIGDLVRGEVRTVVARRCQGDVRQGQSGSVDLGPEPGGDVAVATPDHGRAGFALHRAGRRPRLAVVVGVPEQVAAGVRTEVPPEVHPETGRRADPDPLVRVLSLPARPRPGP